MNPETFARVEELFHRLLELDEAERLRVLDVECANDPDVRREVQRLLASDERAQEGVERFDVFTVSDDPLLGQRLGAWRVVERIASGGMGVVYRAERADGNYEQQAAVKLLRFEVATDEMQRRFEFERRMLARLEHPSVARLLDGGRTQQGAPYLVMEFIDGLPIDEWCDSRGLELEDRLRLFVGVCNAVHHAHKNLIIHRDLKPSNVMVDREGFPKLLDFGIARMMEEEADGLPTQTLARVLTPEYASPEQLQGLPLTTATDVFARRRALSAAHRSSSVESHGAQRGGLGTTGFERESDATEFRRSAAHGRRARNESQLRGTLAHHAGAVATSPARRPRSHRVDGVAQGTRTPLRVRGTVRRRHRELPGGQAGPRAPRHFRVSRASLREAQPSRSDACKSAAPDLVLGTSGVPACTSRSGGLGRSRAPSGIGGA